MDLPIDAVLDDLVTASRDARGFVLVAPPGAGKTTRVPRMLADGEVRGQILVVQPRRVAARSAAARLAVEDGSPLGERMGYAVRFDRRATAATRVVVMTEGVLLRRLQADPFLSDVGAVLLDEFHERSLASDLALGLLAEVRRDARPDLIVGVMSATLDPAAVAAFLGGVPTVRSEGRTFPLTVTHRACDVGPATHPRDLARDVADAIVEASWAAEGDVLAFLPTIRAVRETVDLVRARRADLDVLPLHGALSPAEQDRALAPASSRRVVVATNLAETSVTVPGVRIVVDTGLARQPRFSSSTGLDRLETVRISKASADQRAGRAGRTAPGRVVRLWPARSHDARPAFEPPEVHRVDLAGAVLQLLAWGTAPEAFAWFDPPPGPMLSAAQALLADLGATEGGGLSSRGRAMADLPLHPRLARLVLAGDLDARWAAAWLADSGRSDLPADLELAVEAIASAPPRPVRRAFEQLVRIAPPAPRARRLPDAVLAAWPDRVAQVRPHAPDRARLVGGRGVRFAPDALPPPYVVAIDVDD
ncbi:MAG: helicase-related protein, partial [Myxococcota bacterium]